MIHAILLAGGSGNRMQTETPKQLMELNGKKVVCWSLEVFEKSRLIDDIILVTRKEDIPFFRSEIVDRYGYRKVRRICPGGERRVDSVENGLNTINEDEDEERIVLIHDSARPFVTERMIEDSVNCIRDGFKACTVGVPVKDTIKKVTESGGHVIGTDTPERSKLYIIQTPQTFSLNTIKKAYKRLEAVDEQTRSKVTDDTMVVEQYAGVTSVIIPGAYTNIKLTTPEDMVVAGAFAASDNHLVF